MGLKKDGTVLLEPWDPETKKTVPDTSRWHDIVAVYNGYAFKGGWYGCRRIGA